MYKKTMSMEKEMPRSGADRITKTQRLEEIERALDKLKSQDTYFQSLLKGE